jgi:hypothetical protein
MCVQLVELLFELFKLLPSFSEIASFSASTSCYHLLKLHAHSSLLGTLHLAARRTARCDNRSRATSRSHSSRSLIIYDDCSRITGNPEVIRHEAATSRRSIAELSVRRHRTFVWVHGCNSLALPICKRFQTSKLALTLLCSGPGGRRFKSSLPDQFFQ